MQNASIPTDNTEQRIPFIKAPLQYLSNIKTENFFIIFLNPNINTTQTQNTHLKVKTRGYPYQPTGLFPY